MQTKYLAKTFFDGETIRPNILFSVVDGIIHAVSPAEGERAEVVLDGLVAPGFIDVQVNGGGGVLFNQSPDVETIVTMSHAHAQFGTTSMLPTLITDKIAIMGQAADAIADARTGGISGVLGVHFEGPHLSRPKRGIHQKEFIRSVSDAELNIFCRKDLGKVLVTLAPENVPVDVISDLVSQGVLICLGHSNADVDTVFAALHAGASGFTHLFNAMSPFTAREPGMVGAALLDNSAYCGLIVDHHHVHPLSSKLAIKTKGPKHIMLVTDAMAHVGTSQSSLPYFDTEIIRRGNKLTIPDGTLAGSALDMATAVRQCHQDLAISLVDSLTMASSTPAHFLGLKNSIGSLTVGKQADMLLLDEQLQVQASWKMGERVFLAKNLSK